MPVVGVDPAEPAGNEVALGKLDAPLLENGRVGVEENPDESELMGVVPADDAVEPSDDPIACAVMVALASPRVSVYVLTPVEISLGRLSGPVI